MLMTCTVAQDSGLASLRCGALLFLEEAQAKRETADPQAERKVLQGGNRNAAACEWHLQAEIPAQNAKTEKQPATIMIIDQGPAQ